MEVPCLLRWRSSSSGKWKKKLCSEQSNKNWVYVIISSAAPTTNCVTKNAPVLKLYKINVWQFKILTSDGDDFSFPPAHDVVPRTDTICGPQNWYHMFSPKLSSYVDPRNAIFMWSPQMPSHMGHRIAIVFGPKNCHRFWSTELTLCLPHRCFHMWAPELSSHGPQNCHLHALPRTDICTWSPQMSSLVVSQNWYPYVVSATFIAHVPQTCHRVVPRTAILMWSPQLPSSCGPQNCHPHGVPTAANLIGPQNCHPHVHNCHPHVVSTTATLIWSPELTLHVIYRTDLN